MARNEIIFVVLVLAGIWGVSWWQLKIGETKTRDVQRKADLNLVARAMTGYLAEVGTLPLATEDGKMIGCGDKGYEACDWGGQKSVRDLAGLVYLRSVPTDPQVGRGRKYVYWVDETKQKYKLYAALEYQADPERKDNLTVECGTGVQCNWYVGN